MRERSLGSLLEKLVHIGVAHPEDSRRVEIWLIEEGDICPRCPRRPECLDQTRCLHLVASGNNPLTGVGEDKARSLDADARIPLGVGAIGKIAVTGQPIDLRDLDEEPGEFSRLDWLKREQIRGLAGSAISFKGEILGVLTTIARVNMPGMESRRSWHQIFADHIGGAVANARAFEEIERLKAQLEMENAYLQEEVVEARAFGDLVGQSAALRHIISQIDLVAPTDASVLILGQTGTGKELVAREIHHRSRAKTSRSSASIAPPSPRICMKANSSATRGARLQERSKTAPDVSRRRRAGPCFWTRSEKFLWTCRANCSVSCRRNATSAWGRTERGLRMCGSSARPIVT